MISEQNVLALLDVERLSGSAEQRRKLVVRIGELVELNGETWVRRNRDKLLEEWEWLVRQKIV